MGAKKKEKEKKNLAEWKVTGLQHKGIPSPAATSAHLSCCREGWCGAQVLVRMTERRARDGHGGIHFIHTDEQRRDRLSV